MLAKGFALLGIMVGLCTGNAEAGSVGRLLMITETISGDSQQRNRRSEEHERYKSTETIIDIGGTNNGSDRGGRFRIESDLLILPVHFKTLALNSLIDCCGEIVTRVEAGGPRSVLPYRHSGFAWLLPRVLISKNLPDEISHARSCLHDTQPGHEIHWSRSVSPLFTTPAYSAVVES